MCSKILVLLLLLVPAVSAVAEPQPEEIRTFDLGVIGKVSVPSGWRVDRLAPDRVLVSPETGKTELLFRKLPSGEFDNAWNYLRRTAQRHGLPPFPRKIDKEWLVKVHADEGLFIHGTAPGDSPASGNGQKADNSSRKRQARYWMFALYRKGTDWFILEAWTDELPQGATILYRIQRGWRLPG